MKINKLKELREKSLNELKEILKTYQAELIKAKTELAIKKLKNTNLIREKHRDISQVKTIIREKGLKIESI